MEREKVIELHEKAKREARLGEFIEYFARLVEQETLERAAKIAEKCELHDGDFLKNSDPRMTIAHEIRGDMYD